MDRHERNENLVNQKMIKIKGKVGEMMSKISKKNLKKILKNLNQDQIELPRKPKLSAPSKVYQLRIDLDGCKPPVWRRVVVGNHLSFAELHRMIQILFGWQDQHVYQFTVGQQEIVGPDIAYGESTIRENGQERASEESLFAYLDEAKQFKYTYGLKHPRKCTIKVEKVESIKDYSDGAPLPVCLKVVKEVPQECSDGSMTEIVPTEEQINDKLQTFLV